LGQITRGLVGSSTYSDLVLILYHIHEDKEVIRAYEREVWSSLNDSCVYDFYVEEKEIAQFKLEGELDEEKRNFYGKKLKALSFLLNFNLESTVESVWTYDDLE